MVAGALARPRWTVPSRVTGRLAVTALVGLTSLVLGFGFWLGGAAQPAGAAEGDCSLGDFVWHDRIYNGLQDPGEAGVAGVTVTLLDADGESVGVEPETTDAQGKWAFTDIACGEYVVQFSDIPGPSTFTKALAGDDRTKDSDAQRMPGDPGVGRTGPIQVGQDSSDPADDTDLTVDAGLVEVPECVVGGFIWSDLDGDGIQDEGEPGVPGITALMTDTSGEPLGFDPVTTTSSGKYRFPGLLCGQLEVHLSGLPKGTALSPENVGDDPSKDSNFLPQLGDPSQAVTRVVVGDGAVPTSVLTIDAGLKLPEPPEEPEVPEVPAQCQIGDFVWYDRDADGLQDEGEDPVPGVLAQLINDDGDVVAETETDSDGKYLLKEDCGAYRVKFSQLPKGYAFTVPKAGDDPARDSNADPSSGLTGTVTLTPKKRKNLTIDAGIYSPSGELPATGSEVRAGLALGGAAAAIGGAFLIARRRRLLG